MMSDLVLAAVMFIAQGAGWIARLGAALAGRVGVRRRSSLVLANCGKRSEHYQQNENDGKRIETDQDAWETIPMFGFQLPENLRGLVHCAQ